MPMAKPLRGVKEAANVQMETLLQPGKNLLTISLLITAPAGPLATSWVMNYFPLVNVKFLNELPFVFL